MTKRHELLTSEELDMLTEIDFLLDEANAHALADDGHCKSSEGYLEVNFGNHWDRRPEDERRKPGVSIFAYLLGPTRGHSFDTIEQALDTVRVWHYNEMRAGDEPLPDPYLAIAAKRVKEVDAMFARVAGMIPNDEKENDND